ncbi:hypothetical protein PR048_006605 [Dryococelus australis]|uniref:Uncharacterized protein n=1 Tax=Dryococelus australis TaxID=614101 RepID=A0ABQ9IBE9_9NEOP|nr:hypothetical protein PR048_006605 [Dryococelus australis]
MQKLNGLNIGVRLHSKRIAMEIICHVSNEIKKRIVKQTLEVSGKISVLIDELTSRGSKTTLITYLKCEVSKEELQHFLFLDRLDLSDHTSKTVAKFPGLFKQTHDATNEVGSVNYFQIFKDKVYTIYSRSPKNPREIAECASDLGQEINQICRILRIRRSILFFEAMKEKPGTKTLEAKIAIKEGLFSSIPLAEYHQNYNHQSLAVNNKFHQLLKKKYAYESLLDELKVLNPDQWSIHTPACFRELEIEKLCR